MCCSRPACRVQTSLVRFKILHACKVSKAAQDRTQSGQLDPKCIACGDHVETVSARNGFNGC